MKSALFDLFSFWVFWISALWAFRSISKEWYSKPINAALYLLGISLIFCLSVLTVKIYKELRRC